MGSGIMDAQDIVIWGKVRPDMNWKEMIRIQELCKWGEQFKLDGFVRYWFNYSLLLDVFAHGALPLGWKWICKYRSSLYHPVWFNPRPCAAKS